MKNKNKTYHLTIQQGQSPPHPLHLTLTPSKKRGDCFACKLEREIFAISERPIGLSWEIRKFCSTCTQFNLLELETGDYEFEDKTKIVREINHHLFLLRNATKTEQNTLCLN